MNEMVSRMEESMQSLAEQNIKLDKMMVHISKVSEMVSKMEERMQSLAEQNKKLEQEINGALQKRGEE